MNKSEIIKLIDEYKIPIVEIDEKRNYWLVRTQSGEFHEEFYFDNFIAIGWDEFSDSRVFETSSKEAIVKEIENKYTDSKQPGLIYNQIERFFFKMKIGDVVMIPTHNSSHISFGIISSNPYLAELSETEIEEGTCPYIKRRDVKWIKTINRQTMDPHLYKMMHSHHTINNANDYAEFIDRTLHSFYLKGDKAHLILNVKKHDKIKAIDIVHLVNSVLDYVPFVNEFNLAEDIFSKEQVDMKATFNSPGVVELFATPIVILGVGLLMHYTIGGEFKASATKEGLKVEGKTEGLLEKIMKFRQQNREGKQLEEIGEQMEQTLHKLDVSLPEELKNLPKIEKGD